MTTPTNINQVCAQLNNAGFELYGSFNEGLQHDIFTCTKGKYSGEVVDIWYNWATGAISTIDYSCQFAGQVPKFTMS